MLHGATRRRRRRGTARETFAGGGAGEDLPTLRVAEGQIGIVHALTALGLAASNGEAGARSARARCG